MTLVLASASPRRQELLKNAGIEFVVLAANIEEVALPDELPRAFAERMAREKASAVWNELRGSHRLQSKKEGGATLVLGADTVVVINDEVLGKPNDTSDASAMLRKLSGQEHSVITGVCLIGNGFEDVRSETTVVHFHEMNEADIAEYAASGEPMDKAGAYAIQGMASRWISKIEGDYTNVVGLPVDLVWRMLREHGLP